MSGFIIKSIIATVTGLGIFAINRKITKSNFEKQHFNEIDAIKIIEDFGDYERCSDKTNITIIGADENSVEMYTSNYPKLEIEDGPKKVYYSDDLKFVAFSKEDIVCMQMRYNSFF